jgi:glycosyltransferase involved in cell wall biosynthesis
MLISVIVTTYNRPDALAEVLCALQYQTDTGFEVIVADDGSRDETRTVIDSFRRAAAGRPAVIHAWQSDDGFRLSASRNLGVYASSGEYLVFLDGDCLPRPNFVARHRALAETGFMVSGSRVLLSPGWTDRALKIPGRAAEAARRSWLYWLGQRLTGNANKVVPLLVAPDHSGRHYRKVRWNRIKGCNLGFWRSDYTAVNGCDETFVGWGHEDADLVLRLARHGVKRKSGAFSTEVFHLWHNENTRSSESANRLRVEQRIESQVTQADVGLRNCPHPDQVITRTS